MTGFRYRDALLNRPCCDEIVVNNALIAHARHQVGPAQHEYEHERSSRDMTRGALRDVPQHEGQGRRKLP